MHIPLALNCIDHAVGDQVVKENARNPHYMNQYEDLPERLEVAKSPLNKYRLVLVQTAKDGIDGVVLTTILLHNFSQWIANDYPLKPSKEDPQGYGQP